MNQSQLEELKVIIASLETSNYHTAHVWSNKIENAAYCYGYSSATIRDTISNLKAFVEEQEYAIEVESEENFTDAYDDGGCGHDQNEAYYESPLERL
jgi:hypothetical protein